MKKLLMVSTAAALAITGTASLSAQDTGTNGADAALVESNGAIVTRENTEETRDVLDENGDPVLNEDGTTKTETVKSGFTQ